MLSALLVIALAYTTSLWVGLILWALSSGLGFSSTSTQDRSAKPSCRTTCSADHQYRDGACVVSAALGALAGGWLIERTGDVRLVYAVIGAVTFLIALVFRVASPLGRAERYLAPASAAAE